LTQKFALRKRSRTVAIAVLPILSFLFMAGWLMQLFSSPKPSAKLSSKTKDSNMTFGMIIEEQKVKEIE
jgi:hypothetical protein